MDSNSSAYVDPKASYATRRTNPDSQRQAGANGQYPSVDPEHTKVLLPRLGRNERNFAGDIGKIIAPLNVAFLHHDRVVEIFDEPIPPEEKNQLDRNKLARGGLKFRGFTGVRTKGWIEQFLTTGHMVKVLDDNGKPLRDAKGKVILEFKEKTMTEENARSLIENPFFQKPLPKIYRILPVPVPILTAQGDIRVPRPGFNPDLGIYCALDAPTVRVMDIDEAKDVLEAVHKGFEFKNDQSRTHAYARFLTPYFRGIIGFLEPVPCWFFNANRPRAGKDYLAGMTQIAFEGFAFEDSAINDNADETCKRITAGLLAGRRHFHFANCQGYLQDKFFIQAITDSVWRTRLLGSNGAHSDLLIPNEAEYSLSANAGLTYREDIEPRLRKIDLAYYEEDANGRIFPTEDLHGWAIENRSLLLSAAHSFYQHWTEGGRPEAHPFSSFKRWGKFVGGALKLAELGDPTRPHVEEALLAGDPRNAAIKATFELCYDLYPEEWKDKKDIVIAIAANQDQDERLEWFGDLIDDKAKRKAIQKLGRAPRSFSRPVDLGIRLLVDVSQVNVIRRSLKFTKNRA